MWNQHPMAEDSDGSSQEFKMSMFNELFSSRKRSHEPDDQESNSSSTHHNNSSFKRRCPPWSEIAEGISIGKYTRGPMNVKHDLFGRVEKIYDQGEPTFYHCLGCHSMLRYNTGGSYRRHFINCTPNGTTYSNLQNFDEVIQQKQPAHWFNTSAHIYNTQPTESIEQEVAPVIPTALNFGSEQSLIEWIICDLVPINSLQSGKFSRFLHNFCQSTTSLTQKLSIFDSKIQQIGRQIDIQCEQIAKYQFPQMIEQMNLNGFALSLAHENDDFLLTAHYFDKTSGQWQLVHNPIDFFKSNPIDKEFIENHIKNRLKSMGVNQNAIDKCLITTDDSSMKIFGEEKNVVCLNQVLNRISNRILSPQFIKEERIAAENLKNEMLDNFKQFLIITETNDLLKKLIVNMENSGNNVPSWIQLMQKMVNFLKNIDGIERAIHHLNEQQKIDPEALIIFQKLKEAKQIIEDLKTTLEMLEKPLRYQQAQNLPTLGRVIPIICRLSIDLTKMMTSSNKNLQIFAKIASIALNMEAFFKTKVELEGMAAFLDPNSRRILKTAQEEMDKKRWDYDEIKQAVRVTADQLESNNQEAKPTTSNQTDESNREEEYFFGFQVKDCQVGIEQELADYEAQPIRGHVQPQKFWAERVEIFPKLSQLASMILCAQSISQKLDQPYGIGGLAEFAKRSQIPYSKIPQILITRNSMMNVCEE